MPSFNNVSFSSSRVQRAYKINNIEQIRLQSRLNLLDKERIHRQRLTNQDIRLISLTLDYIRTSSGHSAEGLGPDADLESIDEARSVEQGPAFMYGERIISRKKRRNVRPQSAIDKSVGSRADSDAASTVSSLQTSIRPQSSPNRRTTFITSFSRDDDAESQNGLMSPRQAWTDDEPSEMTKILLRAQAEGSNRRESVFSRDRNSLRSSAAVKALTRNMRTNSEKVPQGRNSINSLPPKQIDDERRKSSTALPRRANISDLIHQGRATLSAGAWKSYLSNGQATPMTSTHQRQAIMDTKKSINVSQTEQVQHKVKKFMKS